MGAKISKCYSSKFFIQSEPNFMINKVVMGEYKVMDILAMCLKLHIFWHFEILTRESMGKPKMCKILKMADRRAKWTKIWDL